MIATSALGHAPDWEMDRGSSAELCGQLKAGKDAAVLKLVLKYGCRALILKLDSPYVCAQVMERHRRSQVKCDLKRQIAGKQALENSFHRRQNVGYQGGDVLERSLQALRARSIVPLEFMSKTQIQRYLVKNFKIVIAEH